MFRNSRNQMPCQVPVASFPFDFGTLTLSPIKDALICAYHMAESAIYPQRMVIGLILPACHRSPLHRACIFPFRLPTQLVRQDQGIAPSLPPKS